MPIQTKANVATLDSTCNFALGPNKQLLKGETIANGLKCQFYCSTTDNPKYYGINMGKFSLQIVPHC